MKSLLLSLALLLLCNFSLFAQIQPDTIKTIDPYDEIVWEVQTPGQVYDVAYHPNGKYVFALDDKVVQMFNASDGSLVKEMGRGLNFSFTDMDLSKDGKLVATCGYLDKIIIFDVETGQEKIRLYDTLFGFTEYRSVSFSPDGKKLVATAGKDFYGSGVLLFDLETGKRIGSTYNQVLPPLYDKKDFKDYYTIKYINNETIIVVSYSNSNIILLSGDSLKTKLNKPFESSDHHSYEHDNISTTIDGKLFSIAGSFTSSIWETNSLNESYKITMEELICVLFNSGKDKIILFGADLVNGNPKIVCKVVDLNSKKTIYNYKSANSFRASLSPNDSLVIQTSGSDQKLQLVKAKWDAQTYVNNEPQFAFNILSVYPNPTSGIVTINTSCLSPQLQYTITNVSGQIILNSIAINNNNQIQLNFSQYPIGVYYLNIEGSIYKLVKE